jgi:ACS family hexuronate transporter-like MFS transporter
VTTTGDMSRYRWLILGIAIVSQISNSLASGVIAPLAPLFQPELGLSKTEVGLFSSVIFVGSWIVLLGAGTLTDRVGVRKVMAAGQVAAGAVMLAMAAAASFSQALLVMFVVGIARGAILPGASKAIMDWFPRSSRGSAMGLKQTGMPIAGILAASILPAVGLALGWRTAIALVGLWVIAAGVLTFSLYRDPIQPGRAGTRKEDIRASVGRLLHSWDLWTVSIMAILFVIAQQAMVAYIPLYLKEVVLLRAVPDESTRIVAAGGFLALCQVGGIGGRIFWGVVSDRLFRGRRRPVLAIAAILSALFSLPMGYLRPDTPLWLLSGLMFLYGITAIGWNGVYHALMGETSDARYAATGVALSMSLTQFGTVGGPPLFGIVVDLTGTYRPAWLLLTACYVGAAVIAILTAKSEQPISEERNRE